MVKSDAKQCPWCFRWCLKDDACAYIFSCGLDAKRGFVKGAGCGRTWCWICEKKFCGQYHDPNTGSKKPDAKDNHDDICCRKEPGFKQDEYCPGGHSGHCGLRW